MNRASKLFGFMCREARGKCENYYQLEQKSSKFKQKKSNNESRKHEFANDNNKKVDSANNIKKMKRKLILLESVILLSFVHLLKIKT